jgi:16S rRNA (adenine1518-N6/adenine1519-N6)-dimethyltransferase
MAQPAQPSEPTQPSLRRMRRFHVKPDRELGQNFLIDSNILRVISDAAELSPADVVLEIGGGLGVLSEHLAMTAGHLHVIEVDRRLQPALEDAVSSAENVSLHWGDAMRISLDLSPQPSKVVANLPYGIAAGVLLRCIEELPAVGLWVAMAQREVGERLAATPGSGLYGISSVIAQLACEVEVARAIPRTVFYPVPNVDSVLMRMRRVHNAGPPGLHALVRASFAHRRKALARSVALAKDRQSRGRVGATPGPVGKQTQAGAGLEAMRALTRGRVGAIAGPAGKQTPAGAGLEAMRALTRERVLEALQKIGLPLDVRAERLSPQQFRELGQMLGIGEP